MKIIILKNKLIEALNIVERAVLNSTTLPILKNVFFSTKEGKLLVSATNLEFAITHSFSGKIVEPGEVTIPCSLLSTIIKNLSSERATLEVKGKKLLITTENYEASIQSQEVKEFPIIPKVIEKQHFIQTSTRFFLEALETVVSATQFSEIRPEISGVFIFREGALFMVGTDSFRLAEKRFENIKNESIGNTRAIIPIRTVEEIIRIFSSYPDETLEIFFDQTQILFRTKDLEIISRLIDGNFPDYKAIIPKDIKNEIVLNRLEFLQAIRLVSTFSTKINDIKISINDEKGGIVEITSSNSSIGENNYKIPAKIKGKNISITFNWRFLIDGLKSFNDEDIFIGINSSDRPVILRGTGDKSLIYVIMPLTI